MSYELPEALQAMLDDIKEKMGDRVEVEVIKLIGSGEKADRAKGNIEAMVKQAIDSVINGDSGAGRLMADVTLQMAMKSDTVEKDSEIVRGITKRTITHMEEQTKGYPQIHPSTQFISLIGSVMELIYATHTEDTATVILNDLQQTAKKLAKSLGRDDCPCPGCTRRRAGESQKKTKH